MPESAGGNRGSSSGGEPPNDLEQSVERYVEGVRRAQHTGTSGTLEDEHTARTWGYQIVEIAGELDGEYGIIGAIALSSDRGLPTKVPFAVLNEIGKSMLLAGDATVLRPDVSVPPVAQVT